MRDFAANIHFRFLPGSAGESEGLKGGYGWFFGRFADWATFRRSLSTHIREFGYDLIECEKLIEISDPCELSSEEQKELHAKLSVKPIQFGTLHFYENDDA